MGLTRFKLLKVIIKSIFKDGWSSRELIGKDSDKVSNESMSFESDGLYYVIRLTVLKGDGEAE